MPHTHKKRPRKTSYTPIEKSHCNVERVIECIVSAIKSNWIAPYEWQKIVKGVNKELCCS
jgi:hypothetical protein